MQTLLECDICTKTIYEGYGFYLEEAESGEAVAVCRNCFEEAEKCYSRKLRE